VLVDLFNELFQAPARVGFVFLIVDSMIRIVALVTVPRGRLRRAALDHHHHSLLRARRVASARGDLREPAGCGERRHQSNKLSRSKPGPLGTTWTASCPRRMSGCSGRGGKVPPSLHQSSSAVAASSRRPRPAHLCTAVEATCANGIQFR
jgi:hypothetical protein